MYPIEYTWTKELIINTGISIDTVKASNLKSQKILKNSLSNHLDKFTVTGILLKPTSKKRTKANIVVKITKKLVIIWDPLLPTFLPKKPDTIDPNNGKITTVKYIIYILY